MNLRTFQTVLNDAKAWRVTNTRATRAAALERLEKGLIEFPDALPLGEEMVLLLKQSDELGTAIDLLRKLERRFRNVGEETLARWGSVLRLRALRSMACRATIAAAEDLREAEAYYARAFEESGGHYPRINQLTTRFVRAGLAREMNDTSLADNLLQSARTDAATMLADLRFWSFRKANDAVWAPASRGEACVLLGRWTEAEAAYAEAVRAAAGEVFPRHSMGNQIRNVLIPAFARLGRPFEGALADPVVFFELPAETAS